jgi:hypothetical protein
MSNMIAMAKTTIVKIIDRLVEKGWITRKSNADRRIIYLNVTSAGRALLGQVMPLQGRSDQRILAPLSRSDRRHFMEMLTQPVHVNNIYSRAPMDPEKAEGLAARTKSSRQAAMDAAAKVPAPARKPAAPAAHADKPARAKKAS